MAEPSELHETLSAGQRLRQARESRGWSTNDVAKRLNLRVSVVEKLESDDYDKNSPATYTKGYIRAYCRLLELKEAEVMAELCSDTLKSQSETHMQSFSRRTAREKSDSWLTLVTWLIGLVILGLLIYFGWQQATTNGSLVNTQAQPNTSTSAVVALPVKDEGVDLGTPLEISEEEQEQSGSQPGDTPEQAPEQQPEPAAEPATTEVTAPEPAPAQASSSEQVALQTLEISFRGDCWVRIEDSTGKRVLEGVKAEGQSYRLQGQAPFSLKLGAPEMVDLTYQGAAVDLSGYKAAKLAKLSLPLN